jgi:enoyl-CoA hydratase/carnithine racemase
LEKLMQGRFEKRGDVGIIWVNNPPVNAISVGVRIAIIDGVTKLAQDAEIKVGVLACEGRTFMAGADITEFGKPPLSPGLHEALRSLENSATTGSRSRPPRSGCRKSSSGFSQGPAARSGCRG